MTTNRFALLSDDELIAQTFQAATDERGATVRLLRLLMEVDQRRLYLQRGYPSLFAFCTSALRLSEQSAYGRITASRAVRRFPALLDALEAGDLTLSSIGRLAPHLSDEIADALLEAARGRSTREVERLVASLYPEPVIPTTVRAMPVRSLPIESQPIASHPSPPAADVIQPSNRGPASQHATHTPLRTAIAPVGPRQYSLRVTISDKTHQKLDRLRSLMRHTVPDGDLAAIIDRALTLLLDQVERQKFATLKRPARHMPPEGRPSADGADPDANSGRRIPAAVRRSVWQRDGGRCAFVGADGRCRSCDFLEFHHVVPFATGGRATTDNIELRCRAHNAYEAVLYFGDFPLGATSTDSGAP